MKTWYRERLEAAAANANIDKTHGAFALGADAIDVVLVLSKRLAKGEMSPKSKRELAEWCTGICVRAVDVEWP